MNIPEQIVRKLVELEAEPHNYSHIYDYEQDLCHFCNQPRSAHELGCVVRWAMEWVAKEETEDADWRYRFEHQDTLEENGL